MSITQLQRAVFSRIADILLRGLGDCPSPTQLGVERELLDQYLDLVPGQTMVLVRQLNDALNASDLETHLRKLHAQKADGLRTLGQALAGTYLLAPEVREFLGYPGQEPTSFTPGADDRYLTSGLLDHVGERGPRFRTT